MTRESIIIIAWPIVVLTLIGLVIGIYKWIESKSKNSEQFRQNARTMFVGILLLWFVAAFLFSLINLVNSFKYNFDDDALLELHRIPGVMEVFVDGDEFGTSFTITVASKNKKDFDEICQLIWTKYRQTDFFDYRVGRTGDYTQHACPDRFHPDQQD